MFFVIVSVFTIVHRLITNNTEKKFHLKYKNTVHSVLIIFWCSEHECLFSNYQSPQNSSDEIQKSNVLSLIASTKDATFK
jgi:hypothetical protein